MPGQAPRNLRDRPSPAAHVDSIRCEAVQALTRPFAAGLKRLGLNRPTLRHIGIPACPGIAPAGIALLATVGNATIPGWLIAAPV